jgi:hypothetical protein
MADSIWESGTIKEVYHPLGVFNDGRRKFRFAAFDILKWASVDGGTVDTYVVPVSVVSQPDLVSTGLTEKELAREFGYPDLHPIVVELHQCGDGSDNVFGLHSFNAI